MKRLFGHGFAAVAVSVLATAFTPACAENDQSIFVRSVLAPSTNRQQGSCVYTNDPTQPSLFDGVVDVAIRDNYTAVVLVGNQMVARGDATNTRAESNRAHVNGAVVRVTDPNGGLIGEFTSLGNGFVDPQNNNQPSFGLSSIVMIDAPTMAKVAATLPFGQSRLVAVNVKAFGRTVGGVDLESSEFQFPVRVCNGCLIVYDGGGIGSTSERACVNPLGGTGGGDTTLPCVPGQDEPTPCQICRASRPSCRGGTP